MSALVTKEQGRKHLTALINTFLPNETAFPDGWPVLSQNSSNHKSMIQKCSSGGSSLHISNPRLERLQKKKKKANHVMHNALMHKVNSSDLIRSEHAKFYWPLCTTKKTSMENEIPTSVSITALSWAAS